MTIICSVAAVFNDFKGNRYDITGGDIGLIKTDVPDWVENTIMFKLLLKDGSIQYVTTENKKQMENDPLNGLGADGKKLEGNAPVEVKTELIPERKTRKRKTESGDAT